MSNSIIIISALVVFAIILVLLNKFLGDEKTKYKRRSLEMISREGEAAIETVDFIGEDDDKIGTALSGVPLIGGIQTKLTKSGSNLSLLTYLGILLVVFAIAAYVIFLGTGKLVIALPLGGLMMIIFNNIYLGGKLEKRNQIFINDFPDAIDMIVRSIKSGHPLLGSLKLIADNTRPPLSTEFQRVIDEVSYGRPMSEALHKMADRVGILDVNFFVVILSVQQETGGSMAEVLTNLSNIIRKRKQLALKIRAMTSEGRSTTRVFSAIPFFFVGIIFIFKKDYLYPLIDDSSGNFWALSALFLIGLSIYIARQLCKMEI